MTQLERRLHDRFRRKLLGESPAVVEAVLRAWKALAAQLDQVQLATLLADKNVDKVIQILLSDGSLEKAFADVRVQLRLKTQNAVTWASSELPKRGKIGKASIMFDVLNERHIEALRALDTKVVGYLKDDVRESFRAYAENSLRDGTHPRTIARNTKEWIGLTPYQIGIVRNQRLALENAHVSSKALTYELRDKRYDSIIRKARETGIPIPAEKISLLNDAYLRGTVSHNAGTLAITVTHDALKVGNQIAWSAAADAGIVDRARLKKRWSNPMDGRERPEHHRMHGSIVGFDEPYSNGDTYAGESDPWRCRCIDVVFQERRAKSLTPPVAPQAQPLPSPSLPASPSLLPTPPPPPAAIPPGVFALAGSIDDAREYSKRFTPKFGFHGASLDTLNEINAGLNAVIGEWGVRLDEIDVKTKGDATALGVYRHWHLGSGSPVARDKIEIHPKVVADAEQIAAASAHDWKLKHDSDVLSLEKSIALANNETTRNALQKNLVILEGSVRWATYQDSPRPLFAVAAHEAGHALYFRRELESAWRNALYDEKVGLLEKSAVSEYAAVKISELWAETAAMIADGRESQIPGPVLRAYRKTLATIKKVAP